MWCSMCWVCHTSVTVAVLLTALTKELCLTDEAAGRVGPWNNWSMGPLGHLYGLLLCYDAFLHQAVSSSRERRCDVAVVYA
jgi:hypothetical protein